MVGVALSGDCPSLSLRCTCSATRCTVVLLSSRRVHSFRPVREDGLGCLLAGPVNLTERISPFVGDSALHRDRREADREPRHASLRLLKEGLKIVPGMILPDLVPSSRLAMRLSRVPAEIERGRRGMVPTVHAIIREREEKRAAAADTGVEDDEDLLDVLLRLQKDTGSQ
ncbi:desmethyl-deoxy-podophyllotoxin synthase-like [Lolium perenne]|uniref:desmethyl-deoxy-podophyllotoxin synthase-like n=1 Tax=Lolium perenne TaxID=4522 RepID=UPI003A99B5C8